jgi:hypothetical protein
MELYSSVLSTNIFHVAYLYSSVEREKRKERREREKEGAV